MSQPQPFALAVFSDKVSASDTVLLLMHLVWLGLANIFAQNDLKPLS
jgi:hypothetical protein